MRHVTSIFFEIVNMKYKILLLIISTLVFNSVAIAGKQIISKPTIIKSSVAPPPSTSTSTKLISISTSSVNTSNKNISTSSDDTVLNIAPMVILTANQESKSTTVPYNQPISIKWTSENVDWCTNPYLAAWPNYDKPVTESLSGEIIIDNATTTEIFHINCKQNGGVIVTSSVIVYVEKELVPTTTLTINDKEGSITIDYGSSTTFAWESTETSTSSCNLLIATSTDAVSLHQEKIPIPPSGQMNSGNLYISKMFTIVCENLSGIASSSLLIYVVHTDNSTIIDILNTKKNTQCLDIKNNIRYGSSDKDTENEVSLVQDFLSKRGLYKNKHSGFAGKGTVHAIQLFQKKEGLELTGFFGSLTRARLKQISCKNI